MDIARSLIGRDSLSYSPALTQMVKWKLTSRQYSLRDDTEAVNQYKMVILYPIERAYDFFMRYVDLLNANKLMRFERKHHVKRMKAVFDAYQGRRDKLSRIPPIEFSDLIDIYDEELSGLMDAYEEKLNDSLAASGVSGLRADLLRNLFACFCMISVAIKGRENIKYMMSNSIGWLDFDGCDYMDYMLALSGLNGLLGIETKGVYAQLDITHVEEREKAVQDIVDFLLDYDNYKMIMERKEREANG